MHIPQTDTAQCVQDGCKQWVLTVHVPGATRKAKGQTRILNRAEDTLGDEPRNQWFISVVAGRYQASQATSPAMRAGLLAAGHHPHVIHATTCTGRKRY